MPQAQQKQQKALSFGNQAPYKEQGKPSSELQNRRNLIEVDPYTEETKATTEPGITQRLSILLSIHSNTPEKDTQDLKE